MSRPAGASATFGLLVVTHGRFAVELVEAVRTIVGEVAGLDAVPIDWNCEVEEVERRIREGLKRVDGGRGVLILTDMFGGTPTNVALSLFDRDRIEIVTGVNLPMLIRYANLRGEVALVEAAARIAAQGREAIQVASELLGRGGAGPPGDQAR